MDSSLSKLALASHVYSAREEVTAKRLAMMLEKVSAQRRDAHLASAQGLPLLVSYQSDATSFLTRSQASIATQGGALQRRGRALSEILSEREVMKHIVQDGSATMSIALRAPRQLSAGKRTGNLFAAACSFAPLLRVQHPGICVSHWCMDRAAHDSFVRTVSARRTAYYDASSGIYTEGSSLLDDVKDIHLATGCCAHDGSNALKWSLARLAGEGVTDNIYNACESLRNSMVSLLGHLSAWLAKPVAFSRSDIDEGAELSFWTSLGVDADWLESFCEVAPR